MHITILRMRPPTDDEINTISGVPECYIHENRDSGFALVPTLCSKKIGKLYADVARFARPVEITGNTLNWQKLCSAYLIPPDANISEIKVVPHSDELIITICENDMTTYDVSVNNQTLGRFCETSHIVRNVYFAEFVADVDSPTINSLFKKHDPVDNWFEKIPIPVPPAAIEELEQQRLISEEAVRCNANEGLFYYEVL